MWLMGCSDAADYIIHDSFAATRLRPLVPRPVEKSHVEFAAQSPSVVASSRWNPTPEQLRILEEFYRRGTRTPSADQIQNITAQLRRYGKIEGKNVFYWFQNHKARERQKRRRQMDYSSHVPQFLPFSVSLEDVPITTAKAAPADVNKSPQSQLRIRLKPPSMNELSALNTAKRRIEDEDGAVNADGEGEEFRTLQLFPVKNSINCKEKDRSANNSEASDGAETNSNLASCHFYEFLPLKN